MSTSTPAEQNIGAKAVQAMVKGFIPEKAQGINTVIQFTFTDPASNQHLVIDNGVCTYHEGQHPAPKLTILAPADVWSKIIRGELNGASAFMGGKFKIQGDMNLLMKMQNFFGRNQ